MVFRFGLERANSDAVQNERSKENTQGKYEERNRHDTLEEYDLCASQRRGCEQPNRDSKRQFACVWANDIDKYACQVYRKHYGDKELIEGDIRTIDPDTIPDFDVLTGGFPCQSFSLAGKRKGFQDTRGTLFFEICRVLEVKRPLMLLLENVKGLLSNDDGRTFETILQSLNSLGYIIDYRVLNSKRFGVPQNRERVFIWGLNLPKAIEEYAEDGQKPKGSLLLKTIEGYLLRKLLVLWEEPRKLSEAKSNGWTLDCLIYTVLEDLGLLKNSKSLEKKAKQKLLKHLQVKFIEVWPQSQTSDTNSAFDPNPKPSTSTNQTDTLNSLQAKKLVESDSFTSLLWNILLEDPSEEKKKSIISTLLKLTTESKTYTFVEMEAIILGFIGLEKRYFQNWFKQASLVLTKLRENMNGTTQREKEIFNIVACSVVFGTPDFRNIVGHLRGASSRQIFPFREVNGNSDEPRRKTQGERSRVRVANSSSGVRKIRVHRNDAKKSEIQGYSIFPAAADFVDVVDNHPKNILVANTLSHRYFKDGSENLVQVQPCLTPDRLNKRQHGRRFKENGEPAFTLTGQDIHGVAINQRIRRLTPIECERLQGFPDGYTDGISDTQRYKLLGNAVTTNVIEFLGKHLSSLFFV